jgi:hypothetical protein
VKSATPIHPISGIRSAEPSILGTSIGYFPAVRPTAPQTQAVRRTTMSNSRPRRRRALAPSICGRRPASSARKCLVTPAFYKARQMASLGRSDLGGCSTGSSLGLAPRRILSTYSAARRNRLTSEAVGHRAAAIHILPEAVHSWQTDDEARFFGQRP